MSLELTTGMAKADQIDFSKLNTNLTDNFVLPHYAFFASSADRLASETEEFCTSPTRGDLRLLQDGFNQGMDTFTEISHINFGRIAVLDRYKRLYFWPDPEHKVENALKIYFENPDSEAAKKNIAQMPPEMQGYVTLGHLIFGKSAEAILKNDADGKARCALAVRVTRNIADMAQQIFAEWREGPTAYAKLIETAGAPGNKVYKSANKATLAYLDSIAGMLANITNKKLPLLLNAPKEKGEIKRAECWCSGRSIKNIQINLRALFEMYRGIEDFGFDDVLLHQGQGWLFNDIESSFENAISLANSIQADNTQILKDKNVHKNLTDLQSKVKKLQLNTQKLHSLFETELKAVVK
jgi:predicted lipoprotein